MERPSFVLWVGKSSALPRRSTSMVLFKRDEVHGQNGQFAPNVSGFTPGADGRVASAKTSLADWKGYPNKTVSGGSGRVGGSGDPVIEKMWSQNGFDGKPTVLNAKDFAKAAKGQTKLYRGVTDAKYSQQFKTGKAFGGHGTSGNGSYFTKSKAMASAYSVDGPARKDDGKKLITAVLKPSARVAKVNDLVPKFLSEREKLGTVKNGSILSDMGRYATAMGYDAYTDSSLGVTVVLNRTALDVLE
jgi:hypothetical protein